MANKNLSEITAKLSSEGVIEATLDTTDTIVGTTAITEYLKGEKGDKGDKGDAGTPGFSPIVDLSKEDDTTTLSITSATGTQTVEIYDGEVYTAGVGIDITNNVISNTQTSAEWGNISGTLSNQTDLQSALDAKADIADIPISTSQLTNDSHFVSDANYNHTDNNYTTEEKTKLAGIAAGAEANIQADWNEADSSSDAFIKNKPTIPDVSGKVNITDIINDTLHTDTDKPLSANIGKELQDEINNLSARGRFLALWNAETGLAMSNPQHSPYVYKTGDYFVVGAVGATNYKPTGSSYATGQASSVVETQSVAIDDVYYYDGVHWRLQVNTQKEVTFSTISGQPTDNVNLAAALNAKENSTNKVTSLSSSSTDAQYPSAKCVYDMIGDVESILATLTTGNGV